MTSLEARLHAFRADLADVRLKGEVPAERYVEGRAAHIVASVADVRKKPRADAGLDTQFLHGDDILVFDEADGWVWAQAVHDGYVGYIASAAVSTRETEPTHRVAVPRTFVYPEPDLKYPRSGELSMGSAIAVVDFAETRGTRYAVLSTGGAVVAGHLRLVDDAFEDFVSAAETLLHTPYLWGGVSGFGIDCSGLVQLAMRMAGRNVLRDTDMQAAGIGEPIVPGAGFSGLRRGDLVFWKGHVAIMTDAENIIHASGHTMMVSREGLVQAIERIGYLYGGPTVFRRP